MVSLHVHVSLFRDFQNYQLSLGRKHFMMRNLIGSLKKNGIGARVKASEVLGASVCDPMDIYLWLKEIFCKSGLSHYYVSFQNITQFSHDK